MDKDLEAIVQKMMDAGESEDNIAAVIKEYNTNPPAKGGNTDQSGDLKSASVNTPSSSEFEKEASSPTKKLLWEQVRDGDIDTSYNPDSEGILAGLPEDQVMKLKDEANKKLQKLYADSGVKEYTLDDNQITREALRIHKAKQKEQTEQTKYDNLDFWDNTWKKVKAHTNRALAGLAGLPNYLNKSLFTLFADDDDLEFVNSLDPKTREAVINSMMGANTGNMSVSELGNASAKAQEDLIKKAETIEKDIVQFDNYITDDIANGDYGKAATRIISEGIGSIPSLIQAMIPYVGISSIVAGSAANKQEELEAEGFDLGLDTSANAAINGAAEGLFEIYTKKLGGKLFKSLKGSSIEGTETIFKSLTENLVKAPLYEGGSEAATALVQNLSDSFIQGKEKDFDDAWKEVTDAFLIGYGSGKGLGLSTQATQTIQKLKSDIQVNKVLKSDTNKFNKVSDAFQPKTPKSKYSKDELKIANTPDAVNILAEQLDGEVKQGAMTKEEALAVEHQFAQTSFHLSKTQGVKMTDDQRVEATNLVKRKEILIEKVKNLDSALAEPVKAKIEALDERLKGIKSFKKDEKTTKTKPIKADPTDEKGGETKKGESTGKKTEKTVKDKSKDVADKIRKLKVNSSVKESMSKLNSRPTAVFEAAWDAAIETTASAVELTGNVAQAIVEGVENLRNSDWYRSLSEKGRIKAERMFKEDLNKQFNDGSEVSPSFLDKTKASLNKGREVVIQKLVDKYHILRKEVDKNFDIKDDKHNFSQAEILMHGKAANDLEKFDGQMEKLVKDVASKGLTIDNISDYMYAKHATERNKHIKDNIDPENEFGSGMTPQEVDKILNKTFTNDQIKELESLSKDFSKVIKETRDIMLDSGLINQDQHNAFTDFYENYVPLQGFENEDITSGGGMQGKDLTVSGSAAKRASGRSTRAYNVVANIVSQRVDATLKARKNEVLNTLYNLVKENPDNGVMKLYDKTNLPKKRTVQADGKIVNQPERPDLRNDYVGVKVDGEQYYLKFANEELGRVLNAANIEKTDVITKTLGKINRYLSTTLTTLDPEFVISNFARDIQTAVFNVSAEQGINEALKGQSIARNVVKDTGKSIKAIYGNERTGKTDTEFQKYYEEFKADGAKTGWANQHKLTDIKKKLEGIHKYQTTKGLTLTNAKGKAKDLLAFINDVNTSVENGVRLSAYVNARKVGLTRDQAAELAKELTVNFNKSGEWGTLFNSLYLFFNASVQGNVRFIKAMTTLKKTIQEDGSVKKSLNKGQKLALAMVTFSSMVTMLNQGISEEDEDGQSFYSKIPDYEKERNLIFMNPLNGKDYFKVPLPYGYNIFHNLGSVATEVASGERGVGDATGFLSSAMVGAFSPISMGDSDNFGGTIAKASTPTMMKPIMDIWANEDFFGSQIYNENLPFSVPKPDSHMGRRSTPAAFKNISMFLNEVSGGNEFESGKMDFSPESLYYMFKFGIGGTGKFAMNAAETGGALIDKAQGQDVDVKTRKTPFVRKVYAEPNEYVDQTNYFERYDMIRQREKSLTEKVKAGDSTPKEKLERKKVTLVVEMYKKVAKKLSEIRKKKRIAQKIDDAIKRTDELNKLDDLYFKMIKKANGYYNDKLGVNYQ